MRFRLPVLPGASDSVLTALFDSLIMGDEAYGAEESEKILRAVIEYKKNEIAGLEKAKAKYRKKERIEHADALISYIRADMVAYITVLADMTGDSSLLDGVDTDGPDEIECPEDYSDYLKTVGKEEADLEAKADGIRTDYCNRILEMNYQSIGVQALLSPEMMEYIFQDPYILSVIGDTIFNDDELYEKFCCVMEPKKKGKKKGKKSGKKGGRKEEKKDGSKKKKSPKKSMGP